MSFVHYVSYALVAVGVFTAYMAFISLFRKDKTLERSQRMVGLIFPEDVKAGEVLTPSLAEQLLATFGVDVRQQREAANQLAKAGISGSRALANFVFFKRFIQPVLLIVGLIMFVKSAFLSDISFVDNIIPIGFGFLMVIAGAVGSNLILSNSAEHRRKMLTNGLPEALDLLLICVESGLGVDAAFGKVHKELKDKNQQAISAEFERTRFEMSMLNDRAQALQNLADRTDVPGFRSLVSSLIQAERFGTSMVDTLRLIAEEQREERMSNAELRAARIPALITVPLIFFILPALMIVIIGPPLVKMSNEGLSIGGSLSHK